MRPTTPCCGPTTSSLTMENPDIHDRFAAGDAKEARTRRDRATDLLEKCCQGLLGHTRGRRGASLSGTDSASSPVMSSQVTPRA
jgi:hypothetical protein